MELMQGTFFWLSVFAYAVASALAWFGLIFKANRFDKLLDRTIVTAFIANLAALILRSLQIAYWPVRTVYEFNMVAALLIGVLVLVVRHRFRPFSFVLGIVLPMALLTLGFGYATSPELEPVTAAYKSYWLVIHVLFALLAYACFVVATAGSVFMLAKHYEPTRLDELIFRFTLYGFASDTVMLISGALWAKMLWGQFWAWDPVETWSLISWLVYGLYLHLRLTLGWRGPKMAWLLVAALFINIISIWAVGMFTPNTYHTYENIMKAFFN